MAKQSAPQKFRSSWRIKWIDERNKRCSQCFHSYADAEKALIQYKHEVELIKKGLAHRYHEEKTFNDLCDYWIKNVAPAKRSFKDQVSIVETHLRPFFGQLKLKDITQEHGQNYTVSKVSQSKKTIANHLIVFIAMLNFSGEMKWLKEVPKIRKPKIAKNAHAFSYLRNDQEVMTFLKAAQAQGQNVYVLYATALYTGMRAGELAGLHWRDVDFATRRICVQKSFDNPTKSENVRYVPILDPLLIILKKWKEENISELVFTSNASTMLQESARIYQETFKQVLKNAGFPSRRIDGKEKHYIRFHDLRHTFASIWMMKGGDIYRLQKILGHQSIEMTQRYSHLSPHIFREDYSRFNSISDI